MINTVHAVNDWVVFIALYCKATVRPWFVDAAVSFESQRYTKRLVVMPKAIKTYLSTNKKAPEAPASKRRIIRQGSFESVVRASTGVSAAMLRRNPIILVRIIE